jgi:hypothetical protein
MIRAFGNEFAVIANPKHRKICGDWVDFAVNNSYNRRILGNNDDLDT